MLETIDGGGAAAARNRIPVNVDTSWEPDFDGPFDEPDFESNGITPNIITPSESVEISFDGFGFSDEEVEAINQYSNKAHSSEVPPKETDVTALVTNVTSLNTSTDSGHRRQSRLEKAKQKYDKYVKSPKEAKKKLEEEAAAKEERRGAGAKRRERRESKKEKFKKLIKYRSPTKPVVSPDPKVFDPWLLDNTADTTPKEGENEDEEWENADELWKDDDEEKVPPTPEQKEGKEDEEKLPSTPVKEARTDGRNQDIFRPRGEPGRASPASKDLNDILKDVQGNLEVSAITKTSSFVLDHTADFEYDFNLESTPINLRDRDFQSKIDEKIADDAPQNNDQGEAAEAEEPVPPPTGKLAFFTCGTIDVEIASPKQVIVDFTSGVKTGVKNSVRNFFGQCDVGEGADVVAENVQETKKTWKVDVNKERDHTKDYVAFGHCK